MGIPDQKQFGDNYCKVQSTVHNSRDGYEVRGLSMVMKIILITSQTEGKDP